MEKRKAEQTETETETETKKMKKTTCVDEGAKAVEGEDHDTLIGLLSDPSKNKRLEAARRIRPQDPLSGDNVDRILDRLKVEDVDEVRAALLRAVRFGEDEDCVTRDKIQVGLVQSLFPQVRNADGHFEPWNVEMRSKVFHFPHTERAANDELCRMRSFSPTVMRELTRILTVTPSFQSLIHLLKHTETSSHTMNSSPPGKVCPRGKLLLYYHE